MTAATQPSALRRPLLILLLVFGALYAFVTPPFQVPDEPQHFFRAFEVSEGRLLPRGRGGEIGDELPASLPRVAGRMVGRAPFHAEVKVPIAEIRAAGAARLKPDARVFVPFLTGAYSFVPYAPQALGIAAVRLFSDSVLAMLYAGRLASALVCALLFAAALGATPRGAPVFFLLPLAPMALFLSASHSADAFTNAFCFLFTALAIRFALSGRRLDRRTALGFVLLAAILGLSKPGYLPLCALFLLVPADRAGSAARRNAFAALLLATSAATAAAWAAAIRAIYPPLHGALGFDPARQVHAALAHPLDALALIAGYYARRAPVLANQWIGKLGWVDTPMPPALVVALFAGLIAVAATSGGPDRAWTGRQRAVLLLALGLCLAWMTALLYALFTRPGERDLGGMQGRYFVPLGPLALLTLLNRRWSFDWTSRRAWLVAAAVAVQLVALAALVRRFYL